MPRIHILGGSGSGTTSLGAALSDSLALVHIDADDYFWLPTDPPFTTKRERSERDAMLATALQQAAQWVLSGSISGWGAASSEMLIDGAVWLLLPQALRIASLRAREEQRFGALVAPGGAQYESYLEFIAWAERYDSAGLEQRSQELHRQWLASLGCRVLVIAGDTTIEERVERVQMWLSTGMPWYPSKEL